MKPVGTITMCFPYVDEETRSVLQSVMDKAENFSDFTKRLCERVCAEESSPLLEYFAVYFPFRIQSQLLIDKLESAGKIYDLGLPLFLLAKAVMGERISWDDMERAQVKALKSSPNDWIVSHQYLTWRSSAAAAFPESDIDITPIEVITSSIKKNADLSFFKSYLLRFAASRYMWDNMRSEAANQLKQALVIARKFDEQIMVVDLLNGIANNIKHTDTKMAIDHLSTSRKLGEQLGYSAGIGISQHQLGHIMSIRGELNAAIEYQNDYNTIIESLGRPAVNMITASFYNQIGDGEKALELAKSDIEYFKTQRRYEPFVHTQMAYAWINLGNLEEAKIELAIAEELATKSGDARQIMRNRAIEGILDKEELNFDAAISTFKEVLNYLEDNPVPVYQNICLLNLTEIEIERIAKEPQDEMLEFSGPWMQRLFEHTEKNDLPGIAARALLLKAKLHHKQKRLDDAREILKEVRKKAKSPSMRYLNDLAISMMPDMIVG